MARIAALLMGLSLILYTAAFSVLCVSVMGGREGVGLSLYSWSKGERDSRFWVVGSFDVDSVLLDGEGAGTSGLLSARAGGE